MNRVGPFSSGQTFMSSRAARGLVVVLSFLMVMAWVSWSGQALAQQSAAVQASKPLDPLTSVPFDRITLIDGLVLNIEPVSPRPLPVYDQKKELERQAAKREIPKNAAKSER